MSTHQNPPKARLTIECSLDEKTYIKILAAKKHMTISEYLLSFAREEMPQCAGQHCKRSHKPNEETKKALKESREGKGETFDSLDDFWQAMGMTPNAET
jgi:hypothetical protein